MTPIPPIWIRNMMMICPVCHIDCRQSGHTDGGGRDEQGIYEMNPVHRGVWQHQQSRTDKDDEHETQQEQEGRLDMAL